MYKLPFVLQAVWSFQRSNITELISVACTLIGNILKMIKIQYLVTIESMIVKEFVRFSGCTNDTAFQSVRSRMISAYKFSKACKVKQLRLGNWREKRYVGKTIMMLHMTSSKKMSNVDYLFT